jgi:hypothetical protein
LHSQAIFRDDGHRSPEAAHRAAALAARVSPRAASGSGDYRDLEPKPAALLTADRLRTRS